MAIQDLVSKCFIRVLIKRSDGERFLLGGDDYVFVEDQLHFSPDEMVSDVVDVHGGDGSLLAGQVRRATIQPFDGYVGDAGYSKSTIELLRRSFLGFFQKNYLYELIYIFPDGTAIMRQRGYIVEMPAVRELYQFMPQYHVAFNFEDVHYYTYMEDDSGEEVFGKSATLLLYNAATGGFKFDEVGGMFDEKGAVFLDGAGGTSTLNVESIEPVYPVWIVEGLAVNPRLENLTNGDIIQFNGTVAAKQTLTVDMLNQTATINGVNVLSQIEGEWLSFNPGQNKMNYITDNNSALNSKAKWQEVVG